MRRPRRSTTPPGPSCGAPISASSTRPTTCCSEFTALENVMLPQMVRGLRKIDADRRARELLGYLGLKERVEHRPSRALRRRAAARRHRPRRRQRAAHPARRRADRQPRPAHLGAGVLGADPARARLRPRRRHRHPQHGSRRPHGPPGDLARRQAGRDGVGNGGLIVAHRLMPVCAVLTTGDEAHFIAVDLRTYHELCSRYVQTRGNIMIRAVVEEAAALASITLFVGMIVVWAQVLSVL